LKHTTLANLVASRICHDLINPIGATHNGIELLALDPNVPKGLEFDLITASLNDAKARVEFCRLVFGAAAADMTVTSATFRSLMSNIFDQKRYGMTWGLPDTIDRALAKRLGLSMLCIEQQMPRGANISISADQIIAETPHARDILPQWGHVKNAQASPILQGRDVQFAVLGAVVGYDPSVIIDLHPQRVELGLR